MEIRSVNNAKIKEWCKLHEKKHREKQQKFLIENEHLIREAIQAQLLDVLIVRDDCTLEFDGNHEVITVSQEVMNKLKMNVSCPDCMGLCHMPKVSKDLGQRIICCDDVQDPGNVGTMIRSAHSFGFDTCIVSDRSVDLFNEKVIRSTQGALFHMNVVRGRLSDFVKKFKEEGIPVYATALSDARGLSTFENPEKVALVFGNEGAGVSKEILEMADDRIFIEMNTFESLNVAIACGICCYWFRKE